MVSLNEMKTRYSVRFLFKVIFIIGVALVFIGFLLLEFVMKKDKHGIFDGTHSAIGSEVTSDANDQKLVDYLSRNLYVRYKVITNLIKDKNFVGRFKGELTLINRGDIPITKGSWSLFFHHPFMILQDTQLESYGLEWSHINGDLFHLKPANTFQDLLPGGSITLPLIASHWLISRSDMLPNWYIVAPGAQPRILQCTAGESGNFLDAINTPAQWKRVENDLYNPFNVTQRYSHNFVPRQTVGPAVIPTPLKSDVSSAYLSISKDDWVIVANTETQNEARMLSDTTGIPLTTQSRQSKCIILTVGFVDVPGASEPHGQQAYSLQVDQQKQIVMLKGQSPAGVFYGIQTLLSLGDDTLASVPVCHIIDVPRFKFRGFMMDVSRNFFPKKDILVLLDTMAMYKLNTLHLHLTDDQGWRLEIPGLPELTQIGSKRGHDLKERSSLLVTLGSGPFTNTSGSGFYTVDDYKEILKFAKARHITVIPEIDMPGHSHAAIVSMEAHHRSHGNDDYSLVDREDFSKYLSVQQFHMNSVNPCLDSTFHFIEHVVRELVAMHKDISPLETFHFGGDEVPGNASLFSPACRKLRINSTPFLKKVFLKRVSHIAHKYNLQLQGWGDVFFMTATMPVESGNLETQYVYANAWTSHHKALHRPYQLANAGYQVILSLASHLYFDHPQEPDPEERGNYWAARYIDTQKVFKYRPDSVYDNIDVDFFGRQITRDTACSTIVNCVPLEMPKNIIGIQSHIWTEVIRTRTQLDEMLYPRLVAFAERAWHRAPWEKSAKDSYMSDWTTFANRLGQKELARLERRGISYYLPPPGAVLNKENQSVDVNTAFPGLEVQYSNNDGRSWSNIGKKTVLSGDILLASRSFDSNRRGRAVQVKLGSQSIVVRSV